MAKFIKEAIIMLLVCILGILLFAVIFYEYIPNRKIVPEITMYSAPEKIQEQMADDIDKKKEQVVMTYEVTSSDLNNYKVTKEYVPGKSNPFASVAQDVETGATTNPSSNSNTVNTNGNNTTSRINTSTGTEKENKTNENSSSSKTDEQNEETTIK